MTAVALLRALARRGVRLSVEAGSLRFTAPRGALTDELRAQVAAQRLSLMALVHRAGPLDHAGEQVFAPFTSFPTRRPSPSRPAGARLSPAIPTESKESKGSKAASEQTVPVMQRTEPGNCSVCADAAWWIGNGVVRCMRCMPPSALAANTDLDGLHDRARLAGWPRLVVSTWLVLEGELSWRRWTAHTHERSVAWLIEQLPGDARATEQ